MNESQDTKVKILREAETLFLRYGFKSITMDDMARELGISKKTLYQYFEDKNDLVNQTVQQILDDQVCDCQVLGTQQFDPVTYMLMITDSVSTQGRQINPGVLFDLKKYFKPAWDKLFQFRTDFVYQQVMKNLEEGMEKGLYHRDFNVKMVARLYLHLVDFLISPETYMQDMNSFKEVHLELMKYHLRAICTDKGLKILNEKLKERNNA